MNQKYEVNVGTHSETVSSVIIHQSLSVLMMDYSWKMFITCSVLKLDYSTLSAYIFLILIAIIRGKRVCVSWANEHFSTVDFYRNIN